MRKKKIITFCIAMIFSVLLVMIFYKFGGNVKGTDDENIIMNLVPLW